ncbi:MAG: hypothetical protein ACPG80_04190, partial [Rickettsiales bacterium]
MQGGIAQAQERIVVPDQDRAVTVDIMQTQSGFNAMNMPLPPIRNRGSRATAPTALRDTLPPTPPVGDVQYDASGRPIPKNLPPLPEQESVPPLPSTGLLSQGGYTAAGEPIPGGKPLPDIRDAFSKPPRAPMRQEAHSATPQALMAPPVGFTSQRNATLRPGYRPRRSPRAITIPQPESLHTAPTVMPTETLAPQTPIATANVRAPEGHARAPFGQPSRPLDAPGDGWVALPEPSAAPAPQRIVPETRVVMAEPKVNAPAEDPHAAFEALIQAKHAQQPAAQQTVTRMAALPTTPEARTQTASSVSDIAPMQEETSVQMADAASTEPVIVADAPPLSDASRKILES